MEKPFPIPFNGGVDRSVAPLYAKKGFYDLVNLKHDEDAYGRLVPTSPFVRTALPQATYYDIAAAGNATEPSTTGVLMIALMKSIYFVLTGKAVRAAITVGHSVLQSFYQTTYPATESIHTGCKLVINSLSGLGIALGSTLDVLMTSATTFSWRKNGGGWTAGVPSTAGVSIDGGNATLYFLASSGFGGTEAWSWTRTDSSYDTTAAAIVTTTARPYCQYNNEVYYVDCSYRICAIRFVGTSTTAYTISAGYRPIYGTHVCTFADHLIVGNYTTTTPTSVTGVQTVIVANSDRTDLDNFVSTSTNEADTNAIPIEMVNRSSSTSYLIGIGVAANRLFAVTTSAIYGTPDYGLPIVFSFEHVLTLIPFGAVAYKQSVFTSEAGLYLMFDSSVYLYDGSSLRRLSDPIESAFTTVAAVYNSKREFIILSSSPDYRLWTHQSKYDIFYSRKCDFGSTYTPYCLGVASGVVIGCKGLTVCTEDISSPLFDSDSGTTFAKPTLVTQAVWDGYVSSIKEMLDVYIGTRISGTSTSSYWAGDDIQANLRYCEVSNGEVGTMTAVSTAVRQPATTGRIPFRQSFTAIALEISFSGPSGDVTKPVYSTGLVVSAIEPQVYGMLSTTEK